MATDGGPVPPVPIAFPPPPPPPPERPRWGRRILLAVGAVVLVFVSVAFWSGFVEGMREELSRGDAPSAPESFSAHGLSFEIPAGLHRLNEAERERFSVTPVPGIPSPADGPWFEVLALDGTNLMMVFPDELPWVVEESNLETHIQVLALGIEEILDTTVDIEPGTLAGYPSLELGSSEVEVPTGGRAFSWSVEAFDGNLGYGFLCQYTEARADRMQDLCQRVLDTLSIEPVGEGAGWTSLDSGAGHGVAVPPGWTEDAPDLDELVHASLVFPGDEAPAVEMQLVVDPLDGSPTPGRYAEIIVEDLSRDFSLEDRTTVTLPAGPAERLVFRGGGKIAIIFAVTTGSDGVAIEFLTSSAALERRLFAPTADAIARSLTIED